ncbi:nuclear transport factor 2 family protein [Nocardia sp. R6R-6]|uniref:nuclear transport factor 2 family protein n=1 Tax=Nocardia sp. R6R-6 TaxID=3459303 RepID=UPI00403D6A45
MTADEKMVRQLQRLLDKQEILEVVTRFARAADRLDRDLFLSTYHPDAEDDHAVFVGGREEFYEWMESTLREQRHSTHHFIGNHSVEIDGAEAHAETYFIASSMTKIGKPFSMVGGRYIDHLVKEDETWTIRRRLVLTDWQLPVSNPPEGAEQQPAPLDHFPARERALAESRELPSRDRLDPSYRRPLTISAQRLARYRSTTADRPVDR